MAHLSDDVNCEFDRKDPKMAGRCLLGKLLVRIWKQVNLREIQQNDVFSSLRILF